MRARFAHLLRTPQRRIAFAMGVSLLIHLLVFVLPNVQVPQEDWTLTQMSAQLTPLTDAARNIPPAAPKPTPPKPKPTPPKSAPVVPDEPTPVAEKAPEPKPVEPPPPEEKVPEPPVPQPVAEQAQSGRVRQIPRMVQMTFDVHMAGIKVGEAAHKLDIANGQYELKSLTQSTGLVGLFKSFRLSQKSVGLVTSQGLQPMLYSSEKSASNDRETLATQFDWARGKLLLSQGGEMDLHTGAQDVLSMLYQLSQLPLHGETFVMSISNGKKIDQYEFIVGQPEPVETAFDMTVMAIPLTKVRNPGQEGLQIWLGLEKFRLLPLRIRTIDRNGDMSGELIASKVYVSTD